MESLYKDLAEDHLGAAEPEVKQTVEAKKDATKEPFTGDRTLYRPDEGKCDLEAYIIDPDLKGTNVRDKPNGKIIATLPHQPDDPLIMVKVTGYKESGFRWSSTTGKKADFQRTRGHEPEKLRAGIGGCPESAAREERSDGRGNF